MNSRQEDQLLDYATKQLTSDQKEKVADRVEQLLGSLESDPVLLEEAYEKLGFDFKELASRLAMGAGMTAGGALGLTGVNLVKEMLHDSGQAAEKARYYKAMLDNTPELTSKDVDSRRVQQHFNTLYKFNPDYASDPLVAGAYVQNAVGSAVPNIEAINNMVGARKNILDARTKNKAKTHDPQEIQGMAQAFINAMNAMPE
jgi:hypothetical protein